MGIKKFIKNLFSTPLDKILNSDVIDQSSLDNYGDNAKKIEKEKKLIAKKGQKNRDKINNMSSLLSDTLGDVKRLN